MNIPPIIPKYKELPDLPHRSLIAFRILQREKGFLIPDEDELFLLWIDEALKTTAYLNPFYSFPNMSIKEKFVYMKVKDFLSARMGESVNEIFFKDCLYAATDIFFNGSSPEHWSDIFAPFDAICAKHGIPVNGVRFSYVHRSGRRPPQKIISSTCLPLFSYSYKMASYFLKGVSYDRAERLYKDSESVKDFLDNATPPIGKEGENNAPETSSSDNNGRPMHAPSHVASIFNSLLHNGYSPEVEVPSYSLSRTVKFKAGHFTYRIDQSYYPYLILGTACRIDPCADDIDLMYLAARNANENVLIGKVNVQERMVLFEVEVLCDSDQYLDDNLKKFVEILNIIRDRFLKEYEILKDDKKKLLQKFTDAFEAKAQDELPF